MHKLRRSETILSMLGQEAVVSKLRENYGVELSAEEIMHDLGFDPAFIREVPVWKEFLDALAATPADQPTEDRQRNILPHK